MKRSFRWILALLVAFASINITSLVAAQTIAEIALPFKFIENTLSVALAPNTSGTQRFTLYNTASETRTFQVEITSTRGWFTQKMEQISYTLEGNTYETVDFGVFVPAGTVEGTYDTIIVKAMLTTGSFTLSAKTVLFTHALSAPPAVTPVAQFMLTTQAVAETAGSVTIKIVRPAEASATFAAVNYATVDGTAISVCSLRCTPDYGALAGRLIFYPGQSALKLTIQISSDTKVEPSEDFTVQLSNPVNAVLGTQTATCVILLRPTVVPATTKVLDAATNTALSGYAANGTLTFSQSTPFLDAVQPNQILISGALPAAPSGFCAGSPPSAE